MFEKWKERKQERQWMATQGWIEPHAGKTKTSGVPSRPARPSLLDQTVSELIFIYIFIINIYSKIQRSLF